MDTPCKQWLLDRALVSNAADVYVYAPCSCDIIFAPPTVPSKSNAFHCKVNWPPHSSGTVFELLYKPALCVLARHSFWLGSGYAVVNT